MSFMDIHVFARTLPIALPPLLYVHQRLTVQACAAGNQSSACIFYSGRKPGERAGDYFYALANSQQMNLPRKNSGLFDRDESGHESSSRTDMGAGLQKLGRTEQASNEMGD